jgi:glycerophosphoryl diester phosphodiesterase
MNRRVVSIIVVGAVAAGVALGNALSASAAACVTPSPLAHRGGTERYVENTRNAYRDASNQTVGFWETDVRFTRDNVPVLMHDETVDRTTGGSGPVADFTYAELSELRTDDDQPVPTLRDFINDQVVDAAYAFVELKVNPTGAQWSALEAALRSRPGTSPLPAISSFDAATLDEAKTRLPTYARALVQGVGDVDPATVKAHASILIKNKDAITAARMAKWTGGGLRVYSWTVNDAAEWKRMASYPGMAGVITDKPRAYLAWKRSRTC